MTDNCRGCGHPIVPLVDARYTGREPDEHWHYECWSKDRPPPTNLTDLRAQIATTALRAEDALNRLRRSLRR